MVGAVRFGVGACCGAGLVGVEGCFRGPRRGERAEKGVGGGGFGFSRAVLAVRDAGWGLGARGRVVAPLGVSKGPGGRSGADHEITKKQHTHPPRKSQPRRPPTNQPHTGHEGDPGGWKTGPGGTQPPPEAPRQTRAPNTGNTDP